MTLNLRHPTPIPAGVGQIPVHRKDFWANKTCPLPHESRRAPKRKSMDDSTWNLCQGVANIVFPDE